MVLLYVQINWKVGLRGKNVPLLGSRSPLCKTIISQIKFSVFNTQDGGIGDKLPSFKFKSKLGFLILISSKPKESSPYLLSSETAAKGTDLGRSAGKEDPVELDSSLLL